MKKLSDMIAEKYPNHEQMEWDVFNGVVEIGKEYARQCCEDLRQRCAENAKPGLIKLELEEYATAMDMVKSTEIILP